MSKLTPTCASIVKQVNGQWYIKWRNHNPKQLFRYKNGLNRIADLAIRQQWADKIVCMVNEAALGGKILTPQQVDELVEIRKNVNPYIQTSFEAHCKAFIADRKNLLAVGTLKTMRVTVNLLRGYAKDVLKKAFPDFMDFDVVFPVKWQSWSYGAPRKHSDNYCSKRLQHIRQFLSDAVEQGIVGDNPVWKSKKYYGKTSEVDDIALTMGDLNALFKLDLGDDKTMCAVRDNFVVACLTGLRFSDFSALKASNFTTLKGQNVVKVFRTVKTSDVVIVPQHRLVALVLERNGGMVPSCPTNQDFNRKLKVLGEMAGFTEGVTLRENVAGRTRAVTKQRFQHITTHTARRTFATIAYREWKVPVGVIMKITGHKTEADFFRYIKLSREVAALEMAGYMD